jgi:hypothetical protein
MDVAGTTWKGESIQDVEILRELPAGLVRVLSDTNGFILHGGAVPWEKASSRRPGRPRLGQALMGRRDVEMHCTKTGHRLNLFHEDHQSVEQR